MTIYDDRDHVLYRFCDYSHTLLYVGVTMNPSARFKQHAADKAWWETVSTIYVERFGSREQLLRAERRAIERERPVYNVALNHGQPNYGSFAIYGCPVCGLDCFYRSDMDRSFHVNGTDNQSCWAKISQGLAGWTGDRFGREITTAELFELSR